MPRPRPAAGAPRGRDDSRAAAISRRPQGQGRAAPREARRPGEQGAGVAPLAASSSAQGAPGRTRNLLSACGGARPVPLRSSAGPAHVPARRGAPRSPYLSRQAGIRPQRPRRRQLPPGRRNPAPSDNHNTERAAGGCGRAAHARALRHRDARDGWSLVYGAGAGLAGLTCRPR